MINKLQKQLKKAGKTIDQWLGNLLPVLMLIVIFNLCFPHVSVAKAMEPIPQLPLQAGRLEFFQHQVAVTTSLLPEVALREPQYVYKIAVTAYTSHVSQTDGSPCITASGFNVCRHNTEDIIATNFLNLPFGTKVRLPELYGDRILIVQDRMNSRYYRTIDIWMQDLAKAKQFGRKWTTIEILPFVR